jgi:septal ring-binding cell division protein DamX
MVTASVATTAVPQPVLPAAPIAETQQDLLAQRLAATTQWLARENPSVYSIQILGAGDDEELRNNLRQIAKSIEINDIFVYRTVANKRPFTTVLVGRFGTRNEALEALEKLPAGLKANRPLLRTVGGVREELRTQKGA